MIMHMYNQKCIWNTCYWKQFLLTVYRLYDWATYGDRPITHGHHVWLMHCNGDYPFYRSHPLLPTLLISSISAIIFRFRSNILNTAYFITLQSLVLLPGSKLFRS